MNSSVHITDLQHWQRCAGLCLICGHPLGLSMGIVLQETKKAEHESEEESRLERLSIEEECPIRLCMMRFFMLGKREECHIVDQYTHLEKRNSDEHFVRVFEKKKAFFTSTPNLHKAYSVFATQIPGSTEMATAIATCRRVAKPLTFSGCRACNMAMEKSTVHANAIYRCFPLTAEADIEELEVNQRESVALKKLLEQIALYFTWRDDKWQAKNGTEIVRDTCLWRCIAHLHCWGRNGKWRSRAVALFHGANYLFYGGTFAELISLEDWHMHVFQPFYTKHYDASTWFGTKEKDVSVLFDFARKDGKMWTEYVTERLSKQVEPVLQAWWKKQVKMANIDDFKGRLSRRVQSEADLMRFIARGRGVQEGLAQWLHYHLFHIGTEAAVKAHCQRFMMEMGHSYQGIKV